MNILQVANFFKPSWEAGGPARVSYEISKELVSRGHDVTVYTTDGFKKRLDVKTGEVVMVDGIKTYYFKNLSNLLASKWNILTPIGVTSTTMRGISSFDVVHIHEGNALLGTVLHHFVKRKGIPYTFQPHGGLQTAKSKTYEFFGRRILVGATKIIALTNTEARYLESMGIRKDRIAVVPNGISAREANNLPQRGKFRAEYSIPMRTKVIMYLGRLHRSKGMGILVDAFSKFATEVPDACLVLCGPDDGTQETLEEKIRELCIEDRVLFTGFVSDGERLAALVDADLLVVPSYSGFPSVFLEACACGTPILTTTKGDVLDWVESVGAIVRYDGDDLKEGMMKLVFRGIPNEDFTEARKRVLAEFDWKNIVDKLEGLYEDMI